MEAASVSEGSRSSETSDTVGCAAGSSEDGVGDGGDGESDGEDGGRLRVSATTFADPETCLMSEENSEM